MFKMITNIKEFEKIFEKKSKNDGTDLIIVDVQDAFLKFFGELYIEKLDEYCEEFKRVYQIWDNTESDKPDYIFKNQMKTYEKTYGGELNINDVEHYFTEPMWDAVKQKLENIPDSGDLFETKYNDYWIYVGGKHLWFFCSKELSTFFKLLKKQERKIILVGGAQYECLEDIYVALQSFGVNVTYNNDLIYSASGSKYN